MSHIIYGIHTVAALLNRNPQRFLEVFISNNRIDRRLQSLTNDFKKIGLLPHITSRQWLDKKVNNSAHQGVIARIQDEKKIKENDLPALLANIKMPLILVLDNITDPHNLGACLRSADAAGVNAVILPHDRSAKLNAVAKKVACGAAESVPLIRVTNLVRTLHLLKEMNIWVIGTSSKVSHTLYQSKMTGPIAIIIGSEGKGMRRLTREQCDELISIPMAGIVSSLNVSVAAGICLFRVVRQRLVFHFGDSG